MNSSLINNKIATLLKRPDIWQSSAPQQLRHTFNTGYARLDNALHQGGWPAAALSEILCDQPGSGELQLLLPAVKRLCVQGRQLIFINPPHLPYAPALQQVGVAPEQVLIINPPTSADQFWAAEQILRADIAAALLFWPTQPPELTQLRKLQLAAQSTQGLSLLMRPCRAAEESSPAALRLRLSPTPTGCQVTIIKQRGGWAGQIVRLPLTALQAEADIPAAELPTHQRATTKNTGARLSAYIPDSPTQATPTKTPATAPGWLH